MNKKLLYKYFSHGDIIVFICIWEFLCISKQKTDYFFGVLNIFNQGIRNKQAEKVVL